ncbi:Coumaroyl-CoA:anthocyanidin 3-O-glucoside-6''-O-coumaroyltransferase 2 [Sesamum angolense]|uniref:Coumaroyl-CoA:anthocyanidin 3-O-glucoside-6''-O-coumaroyltransferase 2 n=1 Tax=Sesamum angolense TaxID=2727404 RepID=A0AAE2BI10_9LAMI|nr:Coumaroyl-CoA:anthocyanidin 3-O-glucoside-6''-O-coumaroyltransferase 2 [Sesamum angolense]
MSSSTKVTVVERRLVSPPSRSVTAASLPLTFLDIPWLLFSPGQPLFFYDFPVSTAEFRETILPNLETALSLTLQHFFPLAGKLVTPSLSSVPPRLEYTGDDSIMLTIAEATAADAGDFKNLTGNHPKLVRDLKGLVPVLWSTGVGSKQPLLAVQITVFPEAGVCMGFSLRHVVADGRTFNNFLRTWGELSKTGGVWGVDGSVTFHDRAVIKDPGGLESTLLKDWSNMKNSQKMEGINEANGLKHDFTRATFVLHPHEMEKIKTWILTRSGMLFGSAQLLLSPYVLTCAFIWACWMKTHRFTYEDIDSGEIVHYFGFIAGGITRLHYTVPNTYVGNLVGFGRSSATRKELMGENGVVYAAKAIGDTIKKLNGDMLGGAKNWISEWKVIHESELHVMVTGSPKLGVYGLDFGWGRPVKIEEVSIDTTGAISLCEGRQVVGAIEIGLALPRPYQLHVGL